MATFSTLIASGKVETAYLIKQAVLVEIKKDLQLINALDRENLSSRKFSRLEQSAEALVVELKAASKEFSKLLFKANPDIETDDNYIKQDKSEKELLISLFDAIEKYIALLNGKGIIYPPDIKPTTVVPDIASILDNQSKNMESFVKTLVEAQETRQDKKLETQSKNLETLVNTLVTFQDKSISRSSAPKATQPSFASKGTDY